METEISAARWAIMAREGLYFFFFYLLDGAKFFVDYPVKDSRSMGGNIEVLNVDICSECSSRVSTCNPQM